MVGRAREGNFMPNMVIGTVIKRCFYFYAKLYPIELKIKDVKWR